MAGLNSVRFVSACCCCLLLMTTIITIAKGEATLTEYVLQRCCTVGSQWGSNHTTCTGPPLPLQGITPEERSSCLTAIYICCIKIHRQLNCERGKLTAKSGQVCSLLATPGGEAHKDCCDGCSLGLKAARKRLPCTLSSASFGSPWDEAYTECCTTSATQGTLTQRQSTGRCETDSPCSQLCNEVAGSIRCSCYPGFHLAPDQRTCIDIDECERGMHSCNVNTEACLNTNGGFQCVDKGASPHGTGGGTNPRSLGQCPPGYSWNAERQTCDDVDECSQDVCPSDHLCSNTVGSFVCVRHNAGNPCPTGFRKHPTINNCIDIDECAEGLHRCGPLELCLNSHGSYQCQPKSSRSKDCPAGLKWNSVESKCEDVNECIEELHNCEEPAEVCRNTIGGYDCDPRCPQGQVYDEEQLVCRKKESCAQNPSICADDEMCAHTGGTDYACVKQPVIICPTGFRPGAATSGLPETCIDIDECSEGLDSCDRVTEKCVNYQGSYGCRPKDRTLEQISCPSGFKYDVDAGECIDVNECELHLDRCNRTFESCVNTNGSFTCQKKPVVFSEHCPPGYRASSVNGQCIDIDECEEKRHKCLPGREECINVLGGYRCQTAVTDNCPSGYRFNTTNRACDDIDECLEGQHNCNLQTHFCANAPGEFQCVPMPSCRPGYVFNVQKNSCTDVDECEEYRHTCNEETQVCENTIGSYRCSPKSVACPYGYRPLSTDHCQDINECAEGLDNCDQEREQCVNVAGSFQCHSKAPVQRCGIGYRNVNGLCTDVNECEESNPCPPEQTCENTEGSYRCFCQQGYTLDTVTRNCKDVNECQLNLHSCSASQRCGNTIGSYTCVRFASCGTGYTLNAHTDDCEDDDECALGTHNCGPGFVCSNTEGSFRCHRVRCPAGQKLLPDGTCQVVVCSIGMESDTLGNCVDINECVTGNVCRPNQRCINSVGSYRCQNLINCGPGYELNEFGSQCVDVDECSTQAHECSPQQSCRNIPGGYICECPPGYSLNNERHCEDVDECTRYRGQICSITSECRNTPGSYVCDCKPGFKKAEDNRNCIDVDECTETANICGQTCINVWGSYQCSCQQGYTLAADGRTCQDINECTMWAGRGSLCIGNCVNEPGSYSCSCPEGYRLGPDKKTCQDIDECEEQNLCKGENEVCLNTRGSFKCNQIICPTNYVRDRDHRNVRGSHDTVMCRKKCKANDIDCTLNETQTITYQGIALPTLPFLPSPLILTTMRAVATGRVASSFSTDYRILEGNDDFTFDILKGRGVGSLRLVKPIAGPQDRNLKVLMVIQHGNHVRLSTMSHHLAILQISVSEYDF